jgi:CRP/FNR family transcriptional regulator
MLNVLAEVSLFAPLPPIGLVRLAQQGKTRHFPAGSPLMHQGDVSDALYIIVEGRVRVERSHPALLGPVLLAELGPGEVVGEMGLLDREPRTATVRAVKDTETLELDAATLELTILAYPEVGTALLRVLSRRLRSTDELMERHLRYKHNAE